MYVWLIRCEVIQLGEWDAWYLFGELPCAELTCLYGDEYPYTVCGFRDGECCVCGCWIVW